MTKEKKYLYCPNCKTYPDDIIEEEVVMTWRNWDGECYQGQKSENTGRCFHSYCAECDTELINDDSKEV